MKNIFKLLFCANVRLQDLTNIYGYDEEQIIELLENIHIMTVEERRVIEHLINEKM